MARPWWSGLGGPGSVARARWSGVLGQLQEACARPGEHAGRRV